jgi:hypothetical protein
MEAQSLVSREDMEALLLEFRKVKHDINNTIAVIMALSELAQRDAKFFEKLTQTVVTRSPSIVAQLQEFQRIWSETVRSGHYEPATPKTPAA